MVGLDAHDAELEDDLRELFAAGDPTVFETTVFEARILWQQGGPCRVCRRWVMKGDENEEALREGDYRAHRTCYDEEQERYADAEADRLANPGYGG